MSENCFFLLHFLSEQGAFVPKTEGWTEKEKKGIVFLACLFPFFFCRIISEKPHYPEGTDALLNSLLWI